MRRLRDVEILWMLRRFRQAWLDPSQARMWSIIFAVMIGVGITFATAYLVLAKLYSEIHVFGYWPVDTPDRRGPTIVLIAASVVAAGLGALAWRCRRKARSYINTMGTAPRNVSIQMWLLILGAGAAIVAAMLYCFI